MEFNNICYGNNEINGTNSTRFNFNSALIISPFQFKELINNLFFNKKIQNNKCFIEEFKTRKEYSYYYCINNKEMKNDIKKMESLKFIVKKENFTFEIKSEQLWYEYKDKLYYLILVPKNSEIINVEWILGQPFLKNYDLIFDKDSKTLGLYKQKNSSNKKKTNNNYLLIILIIFVIILISCLILIIIYLIKKIPRKKRANELNEEYDYFDTKNIGKSSLIN